MPGNSEALGRESRNGSRAICDSHNAIGLVGEARDRFFGLVEEDRNGTVLPGVFEYVTAVGRQGYVYAEPPRGVGKRAGLIAGSGCDQEDSWQALLSRSGACLPSATEDGIFRRRNGTGEFSSNATVRACGRHRDLYPSNQIRRK